MDSRSPGFSFCCDICSKTFRCPSHVSRHKRSVHKIDETDLVVDELPKKFSCGVCGAKFAGLSSCRRHEKKFHSLDILKHSKQELVCAECKEVAHSRKEIIKHISEEHPSVNLLAKVIVLENNSFKSWKCALEKVTNSFFAAVDSYKTKEYIVHHYYCQRSGTFKSKSKGVRRIKVQGSNKTGFFCPSSISTKLYFGSETVEVNYISSHMGHMCDVGRLPLLVNLLHNYLCNCPDAAIKYNLCKHIQAVCMYKNKNATLTNSVLRNLQSNEAANSDVEKYSICQELRNTHKSGCEEWQESATSAVLGILPKIKQLSNETQYKEVVKSISILEKKLEALASEQKLVLPIVSKASTSKNINQQRFFPYQKKKGVTKVTCESNDLGRIIEANQALSK